jgi:predicted HTH transcriptional regulator
MRELNTVDDILSALKGGTLKEHVHVNLELKEDWAQKHGDKISALANKLGPDTRWLVIGVKDSGALANHDEKWAKKTEEVVSQHFNNNLDPSQACTGLYPIEVDGKWIIAVRLQNPGDVVYWGDHAYGAVGTTTSPLSPEDVLKLRLQLPGLTDFSSQPTNDPYSPALVQDFAASVSEKGHMTEFSPETAGGADVLKKLDIAGRQAARILVGTTRYRVVMYDRNGDPVRNERRMGLFGMLAQTFFAEIQNWTKSGLSITTSPYSTRALKEALANAVAHAAYFEGDGDIIVEIFTDRVTVSNLCLRESVYFANRWFSRSHKTVNALLMEVMRIAGLVDELGRGKHLIFSEALRSGNRPPEVVIERAGKFDRWKLTLYGGTKDEKLVRLLERSRGIYKDEQKALIAQALVLWRDKPVTEIRNFIDGDFSRQFAEVLSSLEGPIFYWKE